MFSYIGDGSGILLSAPDCFGKSNGVSNRRKKGYIKKNNYLHIYAAQALLIQATSTETMNNFFKKYAILGNGITAFLIVHGLLIITVILIFTHNTSGNGGPPILAFNIFPIPYLLIQIIWMENVVDLVLKKIEYTTDLKYKRMKKYFTITKWWLFIFSLSMSASLLLVQKGIFTLDIMDKPYLFFPIIAIGMSTLLGMNIFYLIAVRFSNKLLVQSEGLYNIQASGKPFGSRGPSPFHFFALHKRVNHLLIAQKGVHELDWRKDKVSWEDEEDEKPKRDSYQK